MAQTTNGMTWIAALVFVSADGSTWTDVSGHGASVNVSGAERKAAEQNTMSGDTPIVKADKRGALDVTVRFVYTEEAADPFEILRAIHEDDGVCHVQYSPQDGFWFDTGAGVLLKPGYPGGEAGSGNLVMSEFVVKAASLTKADAST